MIEYQDSYRDLYPGYDEGSENEYEDDYYFESKEDAHDYAERALDTFDNLPDPIPIFRSIKVSDESKINKEELGESWSFEKDSALEFGTHANCNYLLSGLVYKKNVDWKNTLKTYTLFTQEGDSDSENEITVPWSESIKELKIEKIK